MYDDEYLETRVLSAQPHQLHMMVVEGALRHARAALAAMEANDYEQAHFALNDARAFVSELAAGLEDDRSPDVVANLKALFAFVYRNFVHADMERNTGSVRDAIRVLELHRETWAALVEMETTSTAPPSPEATLTGDETSTGREWTT